ncbi:ABC transporter permease subunit [Phaeacidiphilus oryzae]|uniref:ABC transporter permease subunit n=1 Tax=Phaeacidiphilus oryzae TaxID=348818 RepID=UPI00056B0090|nr:ABC transporter permease subunit [Phaeacidiphilus oryzae]
MSGATSAALAAEWTKFRTVRGPRWTALALFVATVGLGAVICVFTANDFQSVVGSSGYFDPVSTGFGGLMLGQLAAVVLGVTVIGGEYASGMIRVSLAAVPVRGRLLFAKGVVLAAGVFVIGLITAFVTFFLGQALLGEHGTTIGAPGVLRAVIGCALYLTLLALFSLGATTMLRSRTLALGILVPFFFMVSSILQAIPGVKAFAKYLPDKAGQRIMDVHQPSDASFGPWTGILITVLWVAAALCGGWLVLRQRDA